MTGEEAGFSRALRLSGPREFARVFAEGRRTSRNALLFIACPNALAIPRLGLAVAKRHVRRAVDRNRIKRTIRESFRHHQQALAGLDVVVLVRGNAAAVPARELRAVIDRQWPELLKRCARC